MKPIRASMIALAALAAPITAHAQQAPATPPNPAAPMPAAQPLTPAEKQAQAMMMELQQLQNKLQPVQEKAMQDPKLKAAQEQLGTEIKAAVEKADPGVTQGVQRLQALEAEAIKAQQAGDQAKLQKLVQEAQQLQMRFMNAQQKAFTQPEIATKLQAFQTDLERKMIQVDPQSAAWIKRYKEVGTRLETAMQQAQARGPSR